MAPCAVVIGVIRSCTCTVRIIETDLSGDTDVPCTGQL
jgi:hypothetical protein